MSRTRRQIATTRRQWPRRRACNAYSPTTWVVWTCSERRRPWCRPAPKWSSTWCCVWTSPRGPWRSSSPWTQRRRAKRHLLRTSELRSLDFALQSTDQGPRTLRGLRGEGFRQFCHPSFHRCPTHFEKWNDANSSSTKVYLLTFYPRDAMLARVLATALRLSDWICHKVGVLSKGFEGLIWLLACRLLSTSPILCYKDIKFRYLQK